MYFLILFIFFNKLPQKTSLVNFKSPLMETSLRIATVGAVQNSLILQTSDGDLHSVQYDRNRGQFVATPINVLPKFPLGKQIEISDGLILYLVGLDGRLYAESIIDSKNASKTTAREVVLSAEAPVNVRGLSLILDQTIKILALDDSGLSWTWPAITNKFASISPLKSNITSGGQVVHSRVYKTRDGFSLCHTVDDQVVVWGMLAYKYLYPGFFDQFAEGSKTISQESINHGSTEPVEKYMVDVTKYVQTPFELHQTYLQSDPNLRITHTGIRENIFAFLVEDGASGSRRLYYVNFGTLDNLVTIDFTSQPSPPSWVDIWEGVGRIRQLLIGTRFVFLLDDQGQVTTVLVSKEQPFSALVSDMYLEQSQKSNGIENDWITHKVFSLYGNIVPMAKISELISPQCSQNTTVLALSEDRTTLFHFSETAFNCEPCLLDIFRK